MVQDYVSPRRKEIYSKTKILHIHIQNARKPLAGCMYLLSERTYYIYQSINQFYFLLSATSSMPLALYNGTHTLV